MFFTLQCSRLIYGFLSKGFKRLDFCVTIRKAQAHERNEGDIDSDNERESNQFKTICNNVKGHIPSTIIPNTMQRCPTLKMLHYKTHSSSVWLLHSRLNIRDPTSQQYLFHSSFYTSHHQDYIQHYLSSECTHFPPHYLTFAIPPL